ncbi:MAG: hypothetical protein KatS3mg108_2454 [Isosphaeraceae bacterium]|jgi:hypothetical protein|nr:MAG: hypothetical protein KatS3mg108_2454 [Isosphaeraceae bacterium]
MFQIRTLIALLLLGLAPAAAWPQDGSLPPLTTPWPVENRLERDVSPFVPCSRCIAGQLTP